MDLSVPAGDVVGLKEPARTRIQARGQPKPKFERRVGDHYEQKTGQVVAHQLAHCWENDWYSKRITDPATGEVVYENEHRLSEHRGRGSARYE